MTDIHSHILFNVDDGSKSIEESIEILKELKNIGFDNVILTPHYIWDNTYNIENKEKQEKLKILKEEIIKNNLDINIYLGNEIFISNHMVEDIEDNKASSLNQTKYLLFELPFYNKILNLEDILYEIKLKGYVPILAHPERYSYFQKNYHLVDKLKEEGLLFQANFSSIIGYYGKESEKLLKYMLKNKYINFFGTDIHHPSQRTIIDNFKKIEKRIIKITGENDYQKIIRNGDNLVK